MTRSKTSNEGGGKLVPPNLAEAGEGPSISAMNKPSGSTPTVSPKPTMASTSNTSSTNITAPPSDLEATPTGPAKFSNKLRNQVTPSGLEHSHGAMPASSAKPGSNARKPWVSSPGSDDEYDIDDDTPTGIAKSGHRLSNLAMGGGAYGRESGDAEPKNPGNKPHDTWTTISVHTAKCDKCGGHNRKVVQRCKSCNIQFCKDCLERNTDRLHVADINALDWTPKPMIRGKRKTANTTSSKTKAKEPAVQTPKSVSPLITTSGYTDSGTSRAAPRTSVQNPREQGRAGPARSGGMLPEDDRMDFEAPRRRQQFDEAEYEPVAPRKFKRHQSDFNDEDDGLPKKSRLGRQSKPTYDYEDPSDDEGQEVEDKARYIYEYRRPKDPNDEGNMRRPSYGYGGANGGQESATYSPSTGIRRQPFEYSAPSRPSSHLSSRLSPQFSSQTGREAPMTYEEAIAAVAAQLEEKKRAEEQARLEQEEAIRREREKVALENPLIQQLLKEGKDDEAAEILKMASALMDLRDNKKA
jgi:hypothetical protein